MNINFFASILLMIAVSVLSPEICANEKFNDKQVATILAGEFTPAISKQIVGVLGEQLDGLPKSFHKTFRIRKDLSSQKVRNFVRNNPEYFASLIRYFSQLRAESYLANNELDGLVNAVLLEIIADNNRYSRELDLDSTSQQHIRCSKVNSGCGLAKVTLKNLRAYEISLCNEIKCFVIFQDESGHNFFSKDKDQVQMLSSVPVGSYDSVRLVINRKFKIAVANQFSENLIGSLGGIGGYCAGKKISTNDFPITIEVLCGEITKVKAQDIIVDLTAEQMGSKTKILETMLSRPLVITKSTKGLSIDLSPVEAVSLAVLNGRIQFIFDSINLEVSRL